MGDWDARRQPVITRGDGFYLIDRNGKRYLDGIASMWCNVWGHGKNEIVKRMIDQIHNIQHSTLFGLSSSASIELAEKLLKIAKGMQHVFYSDNGSTAIEVAMKMALQYWRNRGNYKKVRFISLHDGYHGDTIGAMSIGYIPRYFSAYKPMLINPAIKIRPPPSLYLHNKNNNPNDNCSLRECYVDKVEQSLSKHAAHCCGLVMESGAQVAGGARIYPPGYQRDIAALCKKYEVLLILDEIATGFGRLGNMIEYLAQSSIPDIVCFGKSLTAGYSPLAVTLTTNEIFSKFLGDYSQNKQLYHGHTYTGHTLGCSAALANIELYQKHNLMDKIRANSLYLCKKLEKIEKSCMIAKRARCKGLLGAIDLVRGDKPNPQPIEIMKNRRRINSFILQESLKLGVFLRSLGNTLLVIPPLAINKNDLRFLLDVMYELTRRVERLS